jgi:hypothetical protein
MESQVTTTAGRKKTSILTGGKKSILLQQGSPLTGSRKSIISNQRPSTGSRKSILSNQRPNIVLNPSSDNIDRRQKRRTALTANGRRSKSGVDDMLGRLGSPMLGRLGSPTDRCLLLSYRIPHSSHIIIIMSPLKTQ